MGDADLHGNEPRCGDGDLQLYVAGAGARRVGRRALDIFSLGVMIYEMVAGRPPYGRALRRAISWARSSKSRRSRSVTFGRHPPTLVRVVGQAMSKRLRSAAIRPWTVLPWPISKPSADRSSSSRSAVSVFRLRIQRSPFRLTPARQDGSRAAGVGPWPGLASGRGPRPRQRGNGAPGGRLTRSPCCRSRTRVRTRRWST